MNRRLLIICYFYPPLAGGGVHRVLGLTRHLPAHGWDTTVICAGAEDYWVRDESLVARIPASTRVVRVSGGSALATLLRFRRGARGRRSGRAFGGLRALSDWFMLPDSYVGWARLASREAERALASEPHHAVLSSSPPDSVHLAARALRQRHRLPWIADFRDPWIGLAFRKPPTPWHRARQAGLERSVLEGADLVLAASRTHADAPGAYSGARPRQVMHLPNGFEEDAGMGSGADADDGAEADASRFHIVFTGTLSQMPDTDTFIEALADVAASEPGARAAIRATLAGPYDVRHEAHAAAFGVSDMVGFPGPISHARARRLQRDADLLLLWKPRNLPTMVPGKLYEYLDAGRPMVALLESGSEAAALAAQGGATLVPPGDRAALKRAIEARFRQWRARGRAEDARPGWLDEHTRARLSGRLAEALDRLCRGDR